MKHNEYDVSTGPKERTWLRETGRKQMETY